MAIYGYSGKPGAGKSYSVVADVIIPALKAGRTIYHNMILHEAPLRALAGHGGKLFPFSPEATPDELVRDAPLGALVIIDESARYWGAGTKVSQVPPEQFEFFTKHRHRVGGDGIATDIVVICQDFGSQCAAFIRELIEYTYYCVKLTAIGMSKCYRLEVYSGCVKGDSPSSKKLVNKSVRKYRKEIYACYVSHTQSARGVAGEEIHGKGATVWTNWKVIAALVAAVVVIPVLVYSVYASVTGFKAQAIANTKSKAPTAARGEHSEPRAAVAPAPVGEKPARVSTQWRLAGNITIGDRRVFIVDGDHGSRYVSPHDCKRDPAGNFTCVVDGLMVAEWTGPAVPVVSGWFRDTVAGGTAEKLIPSP